MEQGNTPVLVVGVQTSIVILEVSVVVSQKNANRSTTKPSYTALGHIPKGCLVLSQGHIPNYAHSSFIHNKKLKTTKISLNWKMNK